MHSTGDVIGGRYRLQACLGSGGGGVVWSAYDKKLKRTVALKCPHSVHSATDRARFRSEAENAAQLQHPNVITVYDTVDSTDCWLVMEYLPSKSLERLLAEEGPLPPPRVERIGMQVAAALAAAHAKGILHRDVKPGNVLVADGDLAKLGDFGISLMQAGTITSEGEISGTMAYLAPEVANGKAASKASDVFALGATLFAAVEGAPPFGTGDPDAILARVRRSPVPEPRKAGPLAPVLRDMLVARPEKRPTAEEVRQRLKDAAGGWEPPVTDSPKVPLSRRRVPWLVTAALVVVVLLVAGLLLIPRLLGPTASADPIGPPNTADPCALADQNALRPFGPTSLDPHYGNFNRCDLLVDINGESQVDVKYELENAKVPRVVRPGTFNVERDPLDGDSCDRTVAVSNAYDVVVTADFASDTTTPGTDLCGMADAGTNGAVAALRHGMLPRRQPFVRSSMANANACGLFDTGALAAIPGIDAAHPKIGFGNWDCRWESTINPTGLYITFDQGQPPSDHPGSPIQLSGHTGLVEVNQFENQSCDVRVLGRSFPDLDGQQVSEMLVVVVYGHDPGRSYCGMATDFARAAVAGLPA